MRIAYVTESRMNSFLASTINTFQSIDSFMILGHEVVLFAREGDIQPGSLRELFGLENDILMNLIEGRDWPQPWRRFTRVWNAWLIAQEVRKSGEFDLIVGRENYILMHLANLGTPIVVEAHEMPGRFQRPFVRRLVKHPSFRRLTTISSRLRDEHLETFPELDPTKALVLPNAVTRHFLNIPFAPRMLIGSRPGKLQIGYVGSLFPGKGMEIVIPLAEALSDADFHVVGGRDEDIERLNRQGVPPNIKFHGFKSRAKVVEYIDAFDIALLPSQTTIESFSGRRTNYGRWSSPMKLFEYMARARAIVASDLPGIREVVENNKNVAILVEPDNPESWRAAVLTLLADEQLRRLMGNAARVACLSEFNSIARAERMLQGLVRQ